MILIAIGANLDGPQGRRPLETCEWAVGELGRLPGLQMAACSRWYESEPAPPSGQPKYVNGAVRLVGEAEPFALLEVLHRLETEAGRVRGERNAARTLDLDLLAIDDLVIDTEQLGLPHRRLHERGFVLAPLAEIAPNWVHPVLHRPVAQLLADCDQAGLTLLS